MQQPPLGQAITHFKLVVIFVLDHERRGFNYQKFMLFLFKRHKLNAFRGQGSDINMQNGEG